MPKLFSFLSPREELRDLKRPRGCVKQLLLRHLIVNELFLQRRRRVLTVRNLDVVKLAALLSQPSL